MKTKTCPWCLKLFAPHPRLKERQRTCGSRGCQRKQRGLNMKRWKKKEAEVYRQGQADWRKAHPDYWRLYRESHPGYTKRNRIQSKIRWQLTQITLQKKLDILQVTEKQMEFWSLGRFAKQTRWLAPLLYAHLPCHEKRIYTGAASPYQ